MGAVKRTMPGALALQPLRELALGEDALLRLAARAAQGEDVAAEEAATRERLAKLPHGRRAQPVDYMRGRAGSILPQCGLFTVADVPEPRSGLWVLYCIFRVLLRYCEVSLHAYWLISWKSFSSPRLISTFLIFHHPHPLSTDPVLRGHA